jgi:MFS family permease
MKKIEISYHLLQAETLLTVMMFTVPVFTVFLHDIGLDQTAVGISQAIFMAVAMLFDVPSGWIADRFSRKFANCLGDLLVAIGLLQYAHTYDFSGVIISEILIGIGMAFTNGADVGLLRAYALRLKKDYAKVSARLGSLRPIAEMVAFAVGGVVAIHNIRATFVLSAIVFIVGAIISFFIVEIGEKRVTKVHPIKDMLAIAKYSLHGHAELKWRIIAFAVAQNATHTIIWLFTPMLLISGFSVGSLGWVWASTLLVASFGSLVAHRFANRLSDTKKIVLPMLATVSAYLILGSGVSAVTIGFAWVFAFTRGWFIATLNPLVQAHTPNDIQSTVVSVASLSRRVLYIPLVIIVNFLGTKSAEHALLGSAVVYLLFTALVGINLRSNSTKYPQ